MISNMKRISFLTVFLFINTLYAIHVGNPTDPEMYFNGVISSKPKNFSVRAGYLRDNIYKGRYQDKFQTIESTPSDTRLLILAGILTFNLFNRVDLNLILGTSDLEIDQLIFTTRRFAWGTGLKAILLKLKNFDFSFDGKYFMTDGKPQYFLVDGDIYDLTTSFKEKYEEYQASIAMSYKTPFLIPYIGSTFLYSEITPTPKIGRMLIPGGGTLVFETDPSETRRYWGMILGITVNNIQKQASLTVETRMFDQNSVSILGIFRF